MLSFFAKAALSGLIVALVATIARRHPGWGGLVASLPLVSLLSMIFSPLISPSSPIRMS